MQRESWMKLKDIGRKQSKKLQRESENEERKWRVKVKSESKERKWRERVE